MLQSHDHAAPKRPANLSINSDLLAKARRLKLNLSATLERALEQEVRRAERAQWLQDNQQAIADSNTLSEENGLFAESYKTL